MRLNKKELSAKLRVSERSLTTWQKEGLPVLEHGRRGQQNIYDLAAVVKWLKLTLHGSNFRRDGGFIDFYALDRELGIEQPPAPVPPRFPDTQTIRAIEEAEGGSLVHACALMVEVLGVSPDVALKCWQIATGESASAFEDAHGFGTGPTGVAGDARLLLDDDGLQVVTALIERESSTLPERDIKIWSEVFEEMEGGPDAPL